MLPEVSEPTGLLLKKFDELNVIFQSSLYYSNPSDFSPSYVYTPSMFSNFQVSVPLFISSPMLIMRLPSIHIAHSHVL